MCTQTMNTIYTSWLKMSPLMKFLPRLILVGLFACKDSASAETCFINDLLDTASCPGPCCAGRCCESGESPPPSGTSTICWDYNTNYYLYCPNGCCEKGTRNERCCTSEESPFNQMQNWTLAPKPDSTLCFNNSNYPADFIYCEFGCCGESRGQCCKKGEIPPSPEPIKDECYPGCTYGCCGNTMRVRCCVPGEYGTTTRQSAMRTSSGEYRTTTRHSAIRTSSPDSSMCWINDLQDYRHCPLGCCRGRCCRDGTTTKHPDSTLCYINEVHDYRHCPLGCCVGRCCNDGTTTKHPDSTLCYINEVHDYRHCPLGCCVGRCCNDSDILNPGETICYIEAEQTYRYCGYGCCSGKCCSHPSSTMCWMNNIHDYKYCPAGCCGDQCCRRESTTPHPDSTLCFDDKKADYVYCSHGCCGGKCCDLIYHQQQDHHMSGASIAFIVLGTIFILVLVIGLAVYAISRRNRLSENSNVLRMVFSVPTQNIYHEPYKKI